PNHIQAIVGDEQKGRGMSLLGLLAGALTLFASPIIGTLNDQPRTWLPSFGKRGPFIAVGVLGMCACIAFLSKSYPLPLYATVYTLHAGFNSIASVSFHGLVADVGLDIPKARVSSIMAAVNLSGFFFGALVGLLSSTLGDIGLRLVIVAILLACGAVTVFYPEPSLHTPYQEILEDGQSEEVSLEFRGDVLDQSLVANNEQDSPGSARKLVNPSPWRRIVHFFTFEAWEPFGSRDFCLVFASRFLFQVSIATLTQFLQFWISDCINIPAGMTAQAAVSQALIPTLVISPIAAFLTPVMLSTSGAFWITYMVTTIFGIGFGPFLSVEFALLLDILPNPATAARDISIWHQSLVLPQLVATPIAGLLRDYFQEFGKVHLGLQCFGYSVVFSFVIVYLVAGAIITSRLSSKVK
ncbi:MAG: hypothetical protein SGCHY_005065, partial [Lobulomycetales sp.]